MRLRRYVREGERIPPGYGLAWVAHERGPRGEAAVYPIPLNILMRAAYLAWVWALCPWGIRPFEHRCAVLTEENEKLRALLGYGERQ